MYERLLNQSAVTHRRLVERSELSPCSEKYVERDAHVFTSKS